MAPKLSRLFSRHLRSQSHDLFARKDALLIGPGGEIVAAYGAGDRIPAIPNVVTGRLQQYTGGGGPQATAAANEQTAIPTVSCAVRGICLMATDPRCAVLARIHGDSERSPFLVTVYHSQLSGCSLVIKQSNNCARIRKLF